jgi:hypothetical protein
MNIVYSRTKVQGAAYRPDVRVLNPRFFTEVSPKATAVFINGDYPDIRAAYGAAGIPVADFTTISAVPTIPQAAKGKTK